jgi:hypothetical protein
VDGGPTAGAAAGPAASTVGWQGWTGAGLAVAAGGGSAVLDYQLVAGRLVLVAPGGTGPASLPVAVDPATDADVRSGALSLVLDGVVVPTHSVTVLPRFPDTDGRFAVADLQTLGRVLDRTTPGSAEPGELWISGRTSGRTGGLSSAAFAGLQVDRQASIERALRSDPVARAASGLLVAGALLSLGLGLLVLVLLVAAERQDGAGELYSWEADGVSPRTLRTALWWRATSVALPAVLAGVLIGSALGRLVVRLVAVTATAGFPQPPLVATIGAGWAGLAVGAGTLIGLAAAGLIAAGALREPLPLSRP